MTKKIPTNTFISAGLCLSALGFVALMSLGVIQPQKLAGFLSASVNTITGMPEGAAFSVENLPNGIRPEDIAEGNLPAGVPESVRENYAAGNMPEAANSAASAFENLTNASTFAAVQGESSEAAAQAVASSQVSTQNAAAEAPENLEAFASLAAPNLSSNAPLITAVGSTQLRAGDELLIAGRNLLVEGAPVRVSLSGQLLDIRSTSKAADGSDVLLLGIPLDAKSGYISLTRGGQTALSTQRIAIFGMPSIDESRSFFSPSATENPNEQVGVVLTVTDPDGGGDITSASIDLSSIGLSPIQPLTPTDPSGDTRLFTLASITPQEGFNVLAAPFTFPVIARDATNQEAHGSLTLCVGACGQAAPAAGLPTDISGEPENTFPIDFTVRATALDLSATWQPFTGAVNHAVYYGSSAAALIHRLPTNSSENTYSIRGLKEGQQYFFAVSALLQDGTETEKSAVVSAVFPVAPFAAASEINVAASISSTAVAAADIGVREGLDHSAVQEAFAASGDIQLESVEETLHSAAPATLTATGSSALIGAAIAAMAGAAYRRRTR